MNPRINKISIHKMKDASSFTELNPVSRGYFLEYEDEETKLFVESKEGAKPHWLQYIQPLAPSLSSRISNQSHSFLLLQKLNGSTYAITGGYGHNAIRGQSEDDFGIQVALRMMDDEHSIATISQRSIKGATRQLLRSVTGYDPQLDRDNYNRILGALEGKASFEGRRFRIRGKGALVLRTDRPISDLKQVLQDVESILSRDPRVSFPQSYREVTEDTEISNLNVRLLKDFVDFWSGSRSRDDMYLEFKDPLVQFRCEEFHVAWDRRKITVSEFDLSGIRDLLVSRGAKKPAQFEDLKKFRVSGMNEDGYPEFEDETFSKLLVYEFVSEDGISFIHLSGKWFQVLDDIQGYLNSELSKIPLHKDFMPEWKKSDFPEENDYNEHVAELKGWRCLDGDLVQMEGRSKIELCDLFNAEGKQFIHVKRTWGSKASYLFMQGLVSGEHYESSKDFRDRCKQKWPALFSSRLEDVEIVFAVASNNAVGTDFPLNLSYFAKVSLYDAASHLRALGFRVSITGIATSP